MLCLDCEPSFLLLPRFIERILWYAKQIEDKLRKFYQNRSQEDIEFEEEWATFAQEQMEEILIEEGL